MKLAKTVFGLIASTELFSVEAFLFTMSFSLTVIELKHALQEPGCQLCWIGRNAAERYIRHLLWESVNDVEIRRHFIRYPGPARFLHQDALSRLMGSQQGLQGYIHKHSWDLREEPLTENERQVWREVLAFVNGQPPSSFEGFKDRSSR
jgi:hypothetical protein